MQQRTHLKSSILTTHHPDTSAPMRSTFLTADAGIIGCQNWGDERCRETRPGCCTPFKHSDQSKVSARTGGYTITVIPSYGPSDTVLAAISRALVYPSGRALELIYCHHSKLVVFLVDATPLANLCLDDLVHDHRSIGVQRSSSTTASGY